jgi:phosphate transport system substrate-binding protein
MKITACAAALAALFLAATGARAQDVTLSARDGSLVLNGTMQAYDGAFYRVETEYGLLTLDAQGVVCAGPGCPDLTAFVARAEISAGPQAAALAPALIAGYARAEGLTLSQPDAGPELVLSEPSTGRDVVRFVLRAIDGAAELGAGADIALSRRDDPGNPRGRVIALDAFAPLVATGNPLRAIGLADLAAALRGEIAEWGALDGAEGLPIALHALTFDSGLDGQLRDSLLDGAALAPGVIWHDDPVALAAAVARDPLALGMGLVSSSGAARVLPLRGACGAISQATPHALKAEDYPLPAPLYLYTAPRRLPLAVRGFLAYLNSPAAQADIRRAGFVDLKPEERGLEAQGARLAMAIAAAGPEIDLPELQRLVAQMQDTRRLSVTFRFHDGSTTLDTQSRGNLRDLARALEAGLLDGRDVLLAGFSDGVGPAPANRALAGRRAETVRAALGGTLRLPAETMPAIAVDSFGEVLPIACDDTEAGRRANRRVEVWLR